MLGILNSEYGQSGSYVEILTDTNKAKYIQDKLLMHVYVLGSISSVIEDYKSFLKIEQVDYMKRLLLPKKKLPHPKLTLTQRIQQDTMKHFITQHCKSINES